MNKRTQVVLGAVALVTCAAASAGVQEGKYNIQTGPKATIDWNQIDRDHNNLVTPTEMENYLVAARKADKEARHKK